MRKLIVSEFISLDGVIQAPGGAEEDPADGFAHGGWTHAYWHDDIGAHFFQAMAESDAFLLGRKTWQGHGAAFDPMPVGDPFGDVMNGVQKYVVSNTLTDVSAWRNSTLITGDVVAQIRALKSQPGKHILTDGSSVLVQTLIQHDLVDELHLLVYPLALGGGKTIFPAGMRVNLTRIDVRPFPSGVVLMRYGRGA